MKKILLFSIVILLVLPGTAFAKNNFLKEVRYSDTTRYLCRSEAIPIQPGQNLNLAKLTSTCPRARKVFGPGPKTPRGEGYITRFRPNLVELERKKVSVPRVDDLHLHHVVWLRNLTVPTFAAGEEKTIVSLPRGYGLKAKIGDLWAINYMIHNLWPTEGRRVEIRWTIDWTKQNLQDIDVRWMDVAGRPQLYPVFDSEPSFDTNGDELFLFPDEANTPGHPEYEKISPERRWQVSEDTTLLFAAGHMHPGGRWAELWARRNGEDRRLLLSRAKAWSKAGAVSWDVSLGASKRNWKVHLKAGDEVFLRVAYDAKRAAWYEAMGIMPVAYASGHVPGGVDPFAGSLDTTSVLTHGRLPENKDNRAGKKLGLRNPEELSSLPLASSIDISSFRYSPGGYSALRGFPTSYQRPPVVPGNVLFQNSDALESFSQEKQAWHTITSCKAPCNRRGGISYPLADGRFDSGQLGFGIDNLSSILSSGYGYLNEGVTTGDNKYRTDNLSPGFYSYFCRIHPFMRGSFRVSGP